MERDSTLDMNGLLSTNHGKVQSVAPKYIKNYKNIKMYIGTI